MRHFFIRPEVAGGLGRNTVIDRSRHPPIVTKLHYEFDGWLGDVLMEGFPCFVITEPAMRALIASGITGGATFDEVEVSVSGQFNELHPGTRLPKFVWLRVAGKPTQDDFGTASDGTLVVSQRALDLLKRLGISHADIYAA